MSPLPQREKASGHRATPRGHRVRALLLGGALVALGAAIAPASPGRGEGVEATAASASELVRQLGLRLDELATEFGSEAVPSPGFDAARFDGLLRGARSSLDAARSHVARDQACEAGFSLARTVSQLEHASDYGAARDLSRWRFAEHLAASASSILGSFLEDLILRADEDGADRRSLDLAGEARASGDTLRRSGAWTAAAVEFVAGTCALFQKAPRAQAAR